MMCNSFLICFDFSILWFWGGSLVSAILGLIIAEAWVSKVLRAWYFNAFGIRLMFFTTGCEFALYDFVVCFSCYGSVSDELSGVVGHP